MGIAEIITLATLAAGLAGSLIKLYQSIKTQQSTAATLKLTNETLTDVVTALELVPQNESVKKIKQGIKAVATFSGNNQALLADLVDQTVGALKAAGLGSARDETSLSQIAMATRAVKAAREARLARLSLGEGGAPPPPALPTLPTILVVLLVLFVPLVLAGCSSPQRLTTEIYVPAVYPENYTGQRTDDLVIIWPDSVRAVDLISQEVGSGDGTTRTLTVAPIPVAPVPAKTP